MTFAEQLEEIIGRYNNKYGDEWDVDDGSLVCPDGHVIELDGECPDGLVSPLLELGLI